jgi:chromate reductase, NAD(P)H dehydrogenase (quinone)
VAVDRSVGVLVGSLRKASFSRRLAGALRDLAPANLHLSIVEIGGLPHYDQDADDEERPFETWVAFRQAIRAKDAILFVTPEYNRSSRAS